MERHSFPIDSDESPETMWKLCLSTKFLRQEFRWNYAILHSVFLWKKALLKQYTIENVLLWIWIWHLKNCEDNLYQAYFSKQSKNNNNNNNYRIVWARWKHYFFIILLKFAEEIFNYFKIFSLFPHIVCSRELSDGKFVVFSPNITYSFLEWTVFGQSWWHFGL